MLRQSGAIRAGSIEEMMDIALAFEHIPEPAGNRMVIIGVGGGASVILADEFSRAGLTLPRLSHDLRQSLMDVFSSEAGRIFKNPIDLNNFETPDKFFKTMNLLDQSDEADMLIIHVAFDHFGLISDEEKKFWVGAFLQLIGQVRKNLIKPMAVILHSYSSADMKVLAQRAAFELSTLGIAVFPSITRAALALSRFTRCQARRRVESKAV